MFFVFTADRDYVSSRIHFNDMSMSHRSCCVTLTWVTSWLEPIVFH